MCTCEQIHNTNAPRQNSLSKGAYNQADLMLNFWLFRLHQSPGGGGGCLRKLLSSISSCYPPLSGADCFSPILCSVRTYGERTYSQHGLQPFMLYPFSVLSRGGHCLRHSTPNPFKESLLTQSTQQRLPSTFPRCPDYWGVASPRYLVNSNLLKGLGSSLSTL